MLAAFAGMVGVFVLDRASKASVFGLRAARTSRRAARGRRAVGSVRAAPPLVAIAPLQNASPWAWRTGSSLERILAFAAALVALLAGAALGAFEALFGTLEVVGLFGIGAALGGALGNLYDRVRHGAVLDFLRCDLRVRGWHTTFNLADVGIVVGLLSASTAAVAALSAPLPS